MSKSVERRLIVRFGGDSRNGGCGSCDYYNRHYYLDDPESVRGTYGTCLFPFSLNVDDIWKLKDMKESGEVNEVQVNQYDRCNFYLDQRCYGGQ